MRRRESGDVFAVGSSDPRKRPNGDHVAFGCESVDVFHGVAGHAEADRWESDNPHQEVAAGGLCWRDEDISEEATVDDLFFDERGEKGVRGIPGVAGTDCVRVPVK